MVLWNGALYDLFEHSELEIKDTSYSADFATSSPPYSVQKKLDNNLGEPVWHLNIGLSSEITSWCKTVVHQVNWV